MFTSKFGMDWVWSSVGGFGPAFATEAADEISSIEWRAGGGNQCADPTRAHSWLFRSSSSSFNFLTNFSPTETKQLISLVTSNIIFILWTKYSSAYNNTYYGAWRDHNIGYKISKSKYSVLKHPTHKKSMVKNDQFEK